MHDKVKVRNSLKCHMVCPSAFNDDPFDWIGSNRKEFKKHYDIHELVILFLGTEG